MAAGQVKRRDLTLSFEFFPPRTEAAEKALHETVARLQGLGPDYFSVTFGAGGGVRDKTLETARLVRTLTDLPAAPHLSCVGASRAAVRDAILNYKDNGFDHIVALRGDTPSGSMGGGELRDACELVEFIRQETGAHFHIEVACYPEFHPRAKSAAKDLEHFKRKVEAGANSAITQYFYNADAYFRFMESCAGMGIDIPVVPGIMPITNCRELTRFSSRCGAEVPRWILQRLLDFGDDLESIRLFGLDVVVRLCQQLLDAGAPGLHIYTMNQHRAAVAIWTETGLSPVLSCLQQRSA